MVALKTCKTYEIKLHIGSLRGYHGDKFTKEDLIAKISAFQKAILWEAQTVRVTPTTFVFQDYVEEGWEIVSMNYPRFPKTKKSISKFVRELAQYLIKELGQNRITVTEPNKTITFEAENAEEHP